VRRKFTGFPGMETVPALKELNEIAKLTGSDLSVHDKDTFFTLARGYTDDKYTDDQLNDAYLQLHLIVDNGGSHDPTFGAKLSEAKSGKNAGKYDLIRLPRDPALEARDDKRSREALAIAMLDGREMRPVITNKTFLNDTEEALERFFTSTSLGGTMLGNSGVRTKHKQGDPLLSQANVQMWNDIGSGNDRLSDDFIGNQTVEFGHYVPADLGGSDHPSNGRAQAANANHATGKRLGVAGALSALGPKYQELRNDKRFAGDGLASFIYNNGEGVDLT